MAKYIEQEEIGKDLFVPKYLAYALEQEFNKSKR